MLLPCLHAMRMQAYFVYSAPWAVHHANIQAPTATPSKQGFVFLASNQTVHSPCFRVVGW